MKNRSKAYGFAVVIVVVSLAGMVLTACPSPIGGSKGGGSGGGSNGGNSGGSSGENSDGNSSKVQMVQVAGGTFEMGKDLGTAATGDMTPAAPSDTRKN